MKTNEILNKVTLEFAGGGKLDLSDYGPYIVNGEDEVEEINSGNNLKLIDQVPDLYMGYIEDNRVIYTYEQLIEYISNRTEQKTISFSCLYKNEPNLNEHIYMSIIYFYYNGIYPSDIVFSHKDGFGFGTSEEIIENESYYYVSSIK